MVRVGDPEELEPLTDQLDDKFRRLNKEYDNEQISSEVQMEERFTTILIL